MTLPACGPLTCASRIIGAVALVNATQEVLIQLRDNRPDITDPNRWVLPGGGAEAGETEEDAARRELEEETAHRAGPLVPIHSDRIVRDDARVEERHFFLATYDEVQPLVCGEGQALRFASRSEVQQLRLAVGHLELLERIFERISHVDVITHSDISSKPQL